VAWFAGLTCPHRMSLKASDLVRIRAGVAVLSFAARELGFAPAMVAAEQDQAAVPWIRHRGVDGPRVAVAPLQEERDAEFGESQ